MGLRSKVREILERGSFQNFILLIIILNAVTLGLETSSEVMASAGHILIPLDRLFLSIFVIELGLAIFAYGRSFVRDPWRVFDFFVVGIALVPATGPFAILRALRVLRVLRVITISPQMRAVVGGLLHAIPGLGAIFAILGIIFYVSSVMATSLFGESFPEWFGNIGSAMYTLFQVMTLESWSMGIVRPVMDTYPWAWVFFVPFIVVSTFTMLNLFIGVIVNAMQSMVPGIEPDQKPDPVQMEIQKLRDEIQNLRLSLTDHDSIKTNTNSGHENQRLIDQ